MSQQSTDQKRRHHAPEAGMQLDISNEVIRDSQLGALDLYLALACQLYADNRLDYAQALSLSKAAADTFNRELLRLGICVQRYPKPVREAG
jgi:predicted HTH domain antitoxin